MTFKYDSNFTRFFLLTFTLLTSFDKVQYIKIVFYLQEIGTTD